jgi:hypothetical protein
MSDLVGGGTNPTGLRLWVRRAVMTLLLFGVVGLIAWAGIGLSKGPSGPQRHVARLALLPPDAPPPPPPPPEKPKVEPPKTEMKQQLDKPKPEIVPQPEPIKMAGAAGEGPSPFAAGEVKNDYIGGDTGNGQVFAFYAGRVAELIQQQLTRRNARVHEAKVYLWLRPDGTVERYEVSGVNGDGERLVRTAMADLGRFPEAPPQGMPMPVGLEISGQ